jgi:PAS domain S-box-containing protein
MARSSAALAASEARFRALLESSSAGVIITDPDGKIVYANVAYERLAMRSLAELSERGSLELVHPDDREEVENAFRRCLTEGAAYTSEHRYLRDDGSVVWVRSRGDAWRQEGKIGGRVSVIENITAAHLAEVALQESERRYKTLLALAPEAIISIDEDQRITEFNPGAERMFGYSADEAIGELMTMLLPTSFRGSHEAYVRGFGAGTTTAARPMASRSAVHGLRKNGEEFPCEASIMRETAHGKTLYTAILRDISDRVASS